MAVFIYPLLPISITGVATEATLLDVLTEITDVANATGTDGAAAPARVVAVAGMDGGGNLQTLLTDNTGALQTSIPAGIATEAKQDDQITEAQTANTELAGINTELNTQTTILTTVEADVGSILTEIEGVNDKLGASFFTLPYDTLQVVTKTANGPTQIVSKTGGLAGVVVQTLNIVYDGDGDFQSGVVS